jgi:RHS repeat-associated protein
MNGGAVTIIYDGFGNRVAKKVGNVTTTYLVEDDVNPTGLPQVFEESVNGVLQRTYTYGLQRISENQQIQGTWTPSFYGYDGGGSVRQLTGLDEKVTDTYNYDAFGNLLNSEGSTPNNYLYRGEQFDTDLGLYYLRARYYNPQTGRFLSRDPEDGNPRDPRSLHKYLYAEGDPINGIDPRGHEDLIEYRALEGGEAPALEEAGVEVEGELEKAEEELCESFPDNPLDMNDILGREGTPQPDGPLTPGRNKWLWDLGQTIITFEQHPYDVGAPASHTGPHWHVDWPGTKHKTFSPGDKFPGCT